MFDDTYPDSPEVMEKDYANSLQASTNNETLPARLRRQLIQSQKETARLKRLIELLDENPATNEILQLLGKR